jgi:hypothetical protein
VSYAPQTIKDAMAMWVAGGGVNSGIVGDDEHRDRPSYHNGWDAALERYIPIFGANVTMDEVASRDYTYRLARDKVRSNAASAMDLGRVNGTLTGLRAFSNWLVKQCLANPTKYRDIREIIYSPDGVVVRRWSQPDNRVYDVPLTSDVAKSHLWHTHVSFYRDSESRDKTFIFAPYFTPPDTATEDPVGININLAATHDPNPLDAFGTASIVGDNHRAIRISDGRMVAIANGTALGVVQKGVIVAPAPTWAVVGEAVVVYNLSGEATVSPARDIGTTFKALPVPPAPVDTSPFSQADVDAAKKAARGAALEEARAAAIDGAGAGVDALAR